MRWFGYVDDPTAGGTTYDDIADGTITVPTEYVPVTSVQVDPGEGRSDRNNVVMGRRANVAPRLFRRNPSTTVETLAYPKFLRKVLRNALSGAVTASGTAPAAINSTFGTLQSGNLKAIIGWLLREEQLDRMTGMVIGEIGLNFPIEGDGTVTLTMPGLYHRVDDAAAVTDPDGSSVTLPTATYSYGDGDTFSLMKATAFVGEGAGVELDNLAGFGLTFGQGLIDEPRSRFRPNHNIETTVVDGVSHDVWFPGRHKYGTQSVTGRLDFSSNQPDRELLRLVGHAEKLVFEVAAGPLATTPVVDEMLRLTMYKQVSTGGGPEPLQREGDQFSSYEFGGFLDPSVDKDLEATFVGTAALT